MTDNRPIVVGIDGSPASLRALEWAVDEARLRGCGVTLVCAWLPPYVGEPLGMLGTEMSRWRDIEERARTIAAQAADAQRMRVPEVPIDVQVLEGSASALLLATAKAVDAVMVVVGTRGHGGFTGLLLGSVSQQVVHHARCPVVIVPAA